MTPSLQMIIAGICIAAWQICVNASKFPGPVANLWVLLISALIALLTVTRMISLNQLGLLGCFTAASFMTVVIVFRGNVPENIAAYMFMAAAGLLSGVAVWQLNDVLSKVPASEVGGLMVTMMVAQIATAAAYHLGVQWHNEGTINVRTTAAFGTAVMAGLLLPR